jgi:diacylglycerol kinase family enzyme
MKALIILNPASGKKTAEPIKESINTQLKDSQIEFEIYETKKEDNIGDIVRALLKINSTWWWQPVVTEPYQP